jgi:hypothetical protein
VRGDARGKDDVMNQDEARKIALKFVIDELVPTKKFMDKWWERTTTTRDEATAVEIAICEIVADLQRKLDRANKS